MRHPIRAPRGFVMVLVLLLVAALTAVVVGQLGVIRSQKLTAVRDNDQIQARAIAERCMTRVMKYLDRVREDQKPPDWDVVLDPDLNSHPNGNGGSDDFDDDFVPRSIFGGTVVYVPSSEAGQTGLRQALHRWRLVDLDGGACLVRFDDNTDDFKTAGGGQDNATTKFENNGKDVPFRDRDLGIFINAIGIFPKASATAAADAYDRARARVSLKNFIGTGGAPGIVAQDDITVETTIALCGMGGLQGDTLNYKSGTAGVCTCGDTLTSVAPTANPPGCIATASPGSLCDPALACNAGSPAIAPAPTPDVKVPVPVDWLELEGFQDPTNPKSLGQNGVCEFYFRSDNVTLSWTSNPLNNGVANTVETTFMSSHGDAGEIFVWDHTDDDAQGCKTNNTLKDCPAPASNIVTHNCVTGAGTTYTVDGKEVVKRPCAWASGPTPTTIGPKVVCTDDKMTPCWKLVARTLNGSGVADTVVQQDFDTATLPGPVWTTMTKPNPSAAEAREETRNAAFAQVFSPNPAQRVPNIEKYWGDPATTGTPAVAGTNNGTVAHDNTVGAPITDFWNDFCRPTTPCTGCSAGETLGMKNNEHWHFEKAPMCREDFFSPSILVFENQARSLSSSIDDLGRFHVRENWGSGCASGPVQHTIIVQGHSELETNTRICGAFSDCTGFPAAGAACDPSKRPKAKGYVMRAGGACFVGAGTSFIGDFACGNIHINANPGGACSIGNLVAFNDDAVRLPGSTNVCPDATATTGFSTCTKGICIKDSFTMMGDIISDADVCIRSGVNITGSILAGGDGANQGNIFIENNTTINGQLVSEGDIGLKTNVVINNNGNGIFGSRVTTGVRADTSY